MGEQVVREPTWRLHSQQMTNWGTFDGRGHVMGYSPRTTLISGAPGSGKSTLLDAYLAVMMPATRLRFNEASNETSGRNRDAATGQRTLLSYLRGKTGEYREHGSVEMRDKLLRGDGKPTWGAISVNFVNDAGGQFSAIRLYFVPSAAATDSEIVKVGLTSDTHIDTDQLGKMVTNTGFRRDDVESHFPVRWHTKSTEFDAAVQLRLGIGAGGEGTEALILLSRIQSGKAMESVDSMFKELVLDTPETLKQADTVVEAFTGIESAYLAAEEAEKKRAKLEPITALHQQITACMGRVAIYEAIAASSSTGSSVLRTWLRRAELSEISTAIDTNIAERDQLDSQLQRAQQHLRDAKRRRDELHTLVVTEGRDLQALKAQLGAAERRYGDVLDNRKAFDADTAVLELELQSAEDLDAAHAAASRYVADSVAHKQELERRRDEAVRRAGAAAQSERELTQERDQVAKSKGRMPRRLLEARQVIMDSTGLTVEELPFVGELLDVAPEHQRWRIAAEVTLAGITRLLLVDERHLEEFSARVDSLAMSRIRFEGVPLGVRPAARQRRGHVSEVLQFADDSPFIGWVYDRICGSGDDAERVETPQQLGGATLKVTPAGQTRRGRRGAAGTADVERVIGFSNKSRLAELDAQIADEHTNAQVADSQAEKLRQQIDEVTTLVTAHTAVLRGDWARLDHLTAAAEVKRLKHSIHQAEQDNPALKQLNIDYAAAESEYQEAVGREQQILREVSQLSHKFDELGDRESVLAGEAAFDVSITDEQAAILEGIYAEICAETVDKGYERGAFDMTRTRADKRLNARVVEDQQSATSALRELKVIFTSYNELWEDDPNRGVEHDSYPQYAEILAQITADEVYLLREKWRRSMDEHTVTHLIGLKSAYDEAHERIEERLAPIRRILATLPFGERRRRISIERDRLVIDDVSELRSAIDSLTAELGKERTDAEYLTRYHQMRDVIATIRKPEPGVGGAARRRRLLDVNQHIYITAVEFDPDDPERREIKRYDQLAPLSGGERQEFVAFMSAAALRYRLGDTHHERPRFAPVILDEAFIKANGDFARRGVDAWTELGFQLVIAAPQDKVTGVETLMDERKCITKNTRNYSYISDYRAADENA